MDKLSPEAMEYIVERLLKKYNTAIEEYNQNKDNEFFAGRSEAYYEMLDVLQSELEIHGEDLAKYGLNIDLIA